MGVEPKLVFAGIGGSELGFRPAGEAQMRAAPDLRAAPQLPAETQWCAAPVAVSS